MSISPSVMVVDDEEELAYLFMELLKRSGLNSVSFTDPLLALKEFRQNPKQYSLVLSDLRMPGMNGIQLAKSIREHSSGVKIILITAFYAAENISNEDIKEADISDVLQKPVKLDELRTRIHELCTNQLK